MSYLVSTVHVGIKVKYGLNIHSQLLHKRESTIKGEGLESGKGVLFPEIFEKPTNSFDVTLAEIFGVDQRCHLGIQ